MTTKIRNGEKAILVKNYRGGKGESIPVKVMVRADGYAMVRRPGCVPFVCQEKDLEPIDPKK